MAEQDGWAELKAVHAVKRSLATPFVLTNYCYC